MDDDIFFSDAMRIAELIRAKEVSPVEVMRKHIARIEELNPLINAIVTVADGALAVAEEAEAAVMAGYEVGPLHGVPFTAKDSIDTAGVPTQRGSPIFAGRLPETDATSVERLKRSGAYCSARPISRNSPTGSKATICSQAERTTPGTWPARQAVRAGASRLPSHPACRRWALGPTLPYPCEDPLRRPASHR